VTDAALAARCLELLGRVEGAIAVRELRAGRLGALIAALAGEANPAGRGADTGDPGGRRAGVEDPGRGAGAAVVSFLGAAIGPGERQAMLAALRARLAPGAPLLLVDHNQPRRWLPRALATAFLLARGLRPGRARYPVARETQALGFVVERLRLAAGERVQLVLARAPGAVPARDGSPG